MRVAIIDMGTNTFNLLVVEYNGSTSQRLHSNKIAVKLGEGGFAEGRIKSSPFYRGVIAFQDLFETARSFGCEQIYAFATSAVRSASNRKEFEYEIYKRCNVKIDVIEGNREAELVYKGVQSSGVLTDEIVLLMDIGGGSTEFVVANEHQIFWRKSFDLGAARIMEAIQPDDPITPEQITAIEDLLAQETLEVFDELVKYNVKTLVGSSGSFDSLYDMIEAEKGNEEFTAEKNIYHTIDLADFNSIYQSILPTSRKERYNIKGLLSLRVDFIVVSSIFINFMVQKSGVQTMKQCAFSLKEGVLAELKKELTHG